MTAEDEYGVRRSRGRDEWAGGMGEWRMRDWAAVAWWVGVWSCELALLCGGEVGSR